MCVCVCVCECAHCRDEMRCDTCTPLWRLASASCMACTLPIASRSWTSTNNNALSDCDSSRRHDSPSRMSSQRSAHMPTTSHQLCHIQYPFSILVVTLSATTLGSTESRRASQFYSQCAHHQTTGIHSSAGRASGCGRLRKLYGALPS